MNVTTLFQQVNAAYRGSDDDAPTTGTDFNLWLATANRKQSEWARDTKQNWSSLFKFTRPSEPGTVSTVASTALTGVSTNFTDYKVGDKITVSGETQRTIATITSDTALTVDIAFANTATGKTFTLSSIVATSTRQYALHRNFVNPSDQLSVTLTTGIVQYADLVHPQERDNYPDQPFVANGNPRMLHLRTDMIKASSPMIGATLTLPGYYVPSDLVDGTSIVQVDDPYWLAYAVAAELAFNDITYSDKTGDINAKANNLYGIMVTNNRRGTYNTPRVTPTRVNRIVDTRHESKIAGSDY